MVRFGFIHFIISTRKYQIRKVGVGTHNKKFHKYNMNAENQSVSSTETFAVEVFDGLEKHLAIFGIRGQHSKLVLCSL